MGHHIILGNCLAGRSERIRTSDPVVPNDVRYQAALHSVTSGGSIDQHFFIRKRDTPFLSQNLQAAIWQQGRNI